MNFIRWLYQKINKYEDITNVMLLDHLFNQIMIWINNKDELYFIIDEEILNIYFYYFVFTNKTNEVNDEYYLLKYSDDIVDLFIEFKEISKSYGSLLFHEKERTSHDLFNFLFMYIDCNRDIELNDEDIEFFLNEYE